MTTRLVVLGTVQMLGTTYGYAVRQALASQKAHTWTNIRPGSIYHALAQLEREGHLQHMGTLESRKGPTATRYAITKAGELELVELVEAALSHYDQEEFTAGIAFMHLLPRERAIEMVRKRLESLDGIVAFLEHLPTEETPSTPDRNPDIVGSWIAVFESAAAWTTAYIERLERG